MGGRSGGGARGGAGKSPDKVGGYDVVGYKSSPFAGAAKVSSLKVGDRLELPNGRKGTVEVVTPSSKTTVDMSIKFDGAMHGHIARYGLDRYVGAKKVSK